MPRTLSRAQKRVDQKKREKKTNLNKLEQRRLERDCFWTWPLGHVYQNDTVEGIVRYKGTAETMIPDEPVRIHIKTCVCCLRTKNYVVDQTGHLRLDLAGSVPGMNFALR